MSRTQLRGCLLQVCIQETVSVDVNTDPDTLLRPLVQISQLLCEFLEQSSRQSVSLHIMSSAVRWLFDLGCATIP